MSVVITYYGHISVCDLLLTVTTADVVSVSFRPQLSGTQCFRHDI